MQAWRAFIVPVVSVVVLSGIGSLAVSRETGVRKQEFVEATALKDIHFDFSRYTIRPREAKLLEAGTAWLKANPNVFVIVEGHADERGSNEYNLTLGERRAKATRDSLLSLGVSASRITVISYGEETPLCTERSERCWSQNRRVHFLVEVRRGKRAHED